MKFALFCLALLCGGFYLGHKVGIFGDVPIVPADVVSNLPISSRAGTEKAEVHVWRATRNSPCIVKVKARKKAPVAQVLEPSGVPDSWMTATSLASHCEGQPTTLYGLFPPEGEYPAIWQSHRRGVGMLSEVKYEVTVRSYAEERVVLALKRTDSNQPKTVLFGTR